MTTAVPTPRRMSVGATPGGSSSPGSTTSEAGPSKKTSEQVVVAWFGWACPPPTAEVSGEEDGVGRHLDDAEGERDDDEVSSLSDDLRRAVVLLGARHGYGHRPDAPAQDVEGLLARRGRAGRGRGSDRRERRRQREHDAKYEFLPHLLSLRSPQMRRR